MKLVPSSRLVACLAVPFVLSIGASLHEDLRTPVLLADALIVALAAFDAVLAWRPRVHVRRWCRETFSIGRRNEVALELTSTSRRTLHVTLRDDVFEHATSDELPLQIALPPRERTSVDYGIVPHRRGAYALGNTTLRYASPLGLWSRQLRFAANDAVKVYPDIRAVTVFEMMARGDRNYDGSRTRPRQLGNSEFESLRPYQRDDDFRAIDWRATARAGSLVARTYQLEQQQNIVVAVDAGRQMLAEIDGLSLFDHALNASLLLAHLVGRMGDQMAWFAFADDIVRFVPSKMGARAATHLVRGSYDVHPSAIESNPLRAFTHAAPRLKKRSLVIVFTQVRDAHAGRELVQLSRSLSPRHLPLIVLFAERELEALVHREFSAPGGIYAAAAAAELLTERDRLVRDLKQTGALVLEADAAHTTPRLLDEYLRIKARHLL